MNEVIAGLLKKVAEINGTPKGAFNLTVNGKSVERTSTKNIRIESKTEKKGMDIYIEDNTKGEMLHIPVAIDSSGHTEIIYNDFHIGKNCEVKIIAGCGIHNDGSYLTQHDGMHTFYIGENSKIRYEEKHYGEGIGTGERVLNPLTVVHLEKDSSMTMDSIQINGVESTHRKTIADIADRATFVTKEIIMTDGVQQATTDFRVDLNGVESSANIVSRSVAKGQSKQIFNSIINGNNKCVGHSECDAIIMDNATVKAVPDVTANHVDATLIHEAAIGKIAGEQIVKLLTLGMTEEQAEEEIIAGFLR